MKTYNIGMAGSGFMGKAHTYPYKAIPFFYGELPIKLARRRLGMWRHFYNDKKERTS